MGEQNVSKFSYILQNNIRPDDKQWTYQRRRMEHKSCICTHVRYPVADMDRCQFLKYIELRTSKSFLMIPLELITLEVLNF